MRIVLYLYVLLVACPIRYWPLEPGVGQTWRFALNYAHAAGIETLFTTGPLAYLTFPQHVGNNLSQGLLFQAGLWLVLAAIFADVFFRRGLPVRNLTLFSLCFGIAAPLFWFNYFGVENLILAGALLLIAGFHFTGSWTRYAAALLLVGLLPLFKLTAGMIALSALVGFLVDRTLRLRQKAILAAALAALVPAAVTTGVYLWLTPSVAAFLNYLRGSVELIDGYSAAMAKPGPVTGVVCIGQLRFLNADRCLSQPGPVMVIVWALAAAAVLAILLWLYAGSSPVNARFYALLLAVPLLVSFKHGFVRQDIHIIDYFCFVALCMGLVSLNIPLHGRSARKVVYLTIFLVNIWLDLGLAGGATTGADSLEMVRGALRFDRLEQRLDSLTAAFPKDFRIEPELLKLIGDSPVASLSMSYTNLAVARANLTLYPVIQRYAALTPYLDQLNAAWIRDKGPRFLVFDGDSIDGRDPWAETPAMWLEVYRWYDTRLLGPRNLLLERRTEARFTSLETIARYRLTFPGELRLPSSQEEVFWTLHCGYSTWGKLRSLLLRSPGEFISVREDGGAIRQARVISGQLVSPVMGNYLPGNLAQFAEVFGTSLDRRYYVNRIQFWSSENASYTSTCEMEALRLVR